MYTLGTIHTEWKEYEQAVTWYTMGAEAGLPQSMYSIGVCLEKGQGVAALDYPAAADWYRRAAHAGDGRAANNLSHSYTFGRGWAWQLMPATSSPHCRSLFLELNGVT